MQNYLTGLWSRNRWYQSQDWLRPIFLISVLVSISRFWSRSQTFGRKLETSSSGGWKGLSVIEHLWSDYDDGFVISWSWLTTGSRNVNNTTACRRRPAVLIMNNLALSVRFGHFWVLNTADNRRCGGLPSAWPMDMELTQILRLGLCQWYESVARAIICHWVIGSVGNAC